MRVAADALWAFRLGEQTTQGDAGALLLAEFVVCTVRFLTDKPKGG